MKSSTVDEDMTIGELAARFGLPAHVLRHWEAMGLLTPATRVNGRRRYRNEQVIRVTLILHGKEAGFGLDQLREFFTAPDGAARRAVLERHHDELERRIAQAQAQKELIEHVLSCRAEDFMECLEFRQLVEMVDARTPVAPDPADAAETGQPA